MSGGNRKLKRKRRLHKWLAIMLAVLLLTEQSDVFVRAEEGVGDAPQTETSSGEVGTDTQNQDNTAGGDHTENVDNTGDGSEGNDGSGAGGAEAVPGADDGNTGDDTETVPGTDGGNTGDDTEVVPGADNENAEDNTEDGDGQESCICGTRCTADSVNTDCPVCGADYAACAGKIEEEIEIAEEIPQVQTVSGNGDELTEADIATVAEGDDIFTRGGVKYKVIGNLEVEVMEQGGNAESVGATIPEFVKRNEADTVEYRVTRFADRAFKNMSKFIHVDIPDSVTSIGEQAFYECWLLPSITIPDSVTSIGEQAFYECGCLTSIKLSNSMTSIGKEMFYNSGLISIDIPAGVTSIGEFAFCWCDNLKSVEIPDSVTSIAQYAFDCCKNLKSVTISKSVTSIEPGTFKMCERLTSVEIPMGVTSIGRSAFEGCGDLTSVKFPDSVTSIGNDAFFACASLTGLEFPENLTSIGNRAFVNCRGLTGIEIPESVTSIGFAAFQLCDGLRSVTIPEGVTSIEQATFEDCWNLPSVTIPKSVTSIGQDAFNGCRSLTSVTISENLEKISYSAFRYCNELKELNIVVLSDGKFQFPEIVGEYVFDGLPGKRNIRFIDENGHDLTGDALKNAKDSFAEAAKNDGDSDDDDSTWYGWSCEGLSELKDTHKVTINVQKDNTLWSDHNRTFALTRDDGVTFVSDLGAVEKAAEPYTVYDVTGLSADEFQTKGVKTVVTVTVANADATATVDYYTATFYDYDAVAGEIAYGADTDQRSQTVLKTVGRVTVPATNPMKEGYTFDKWVTAPGGDEEFSFASPITSTTKIYASWTKNTAPAYAVTIHVKKDGEEWSGHGRSFALRADGGGFITDLTQVAGSTTYSIYDITGIAPDSYESGAVDTGEDVAVTNGPAEAEVHYYTVTFYDGMNAYQAGTPQEPQIILSGRQAARPADPGKADYQFAGWKTAKGGSTPYKFDNAVTEKTDIYASWIEKTAEQLHITASAEEGGTISPAGDVAVTKGGEQTFTITPDEGNRIKSVTVDGKDVTGKLADHMARARADAKYYTFTNVTENHTIHAAFESDGSNPGGGGDNPNPGGGDNPNPGGGDNPNPGGGGDNSNPGGGSDGSGDDPNPGSVDNTGSVQVTVVSETASPQAGKDSAGNTVPAQSQSVGGQENAAGGHAVSATGQAADGKGTAADGKEPKTGDTSYLEVYATLAMIAGLTWLLLCFMDEARGMSEREKEVFVAAFIRWGKKGGAFRKCCAMAAIFCLLAYYHTIGKRVGKNALPENYLGQAS